MIKVANKVTVYEQSGQVEPNVTLEVNSHWSGNTLVDLVIKDSNGLGIEISVSASDLLAAINNSTNKGMR